MNDTTRFQYVSDGRRRRNSTCHPNYQVLGSLQLGIPQKNDLIALIWSRDCCHFACSAHILSCVKSSNIVIAPEGTSATSKAAANSTPKTRSPDPSNLASPRLSPWSNSLFDFKVWGDVMVQILTIPRTLVSPFTHFLLVADSRIAVLEEICPIVSANKSPFRHLSPKPIFSLFL